VKAGVTDVGKAALAQAERLLAAKAAPAQAGETRARSLSTALSAHPDANLTVISVAGRYAAQEARDALERGVHVLLFSDNVALEEEIALKRLAHSRGLLCMGPDAGTAIVNGSASDSPTPSRAAPSGWWAHLGRGCKGSRAGWRGAAQGSARQLAWAAATSANRSAG